MHIQFALTWWEYKHTKTHYLHKLFSLVWNGLPCFSNALAIVYSLQNSDDVCLCSTIIFDLILITRVHNWLHL